MCIRDSLNDDRPGSERRGFHGGWGSDAARASEPSGEVDIHELADLRLTQELVEPQGVLHPGRGRSGLAEALAVRPVEAFCHAETAREQRSGTERWGCLLSLIHISEPTRPY